MCYECQQYRRTEEVWFNSRKEPVLCDTCVAVAEERQRRRQHPLPKILREATPKGWTPYPREVLELMKMMSQEERNAMYESVE